MNYTSIVRAEEVKEGDYLLGNINGPGWPLEALRVIKSVWNGHSRTERRIETFYGRNRVVDKDTLLVVVR